jgi:hypothetical protein
MVVDVRVVADVGDLTRDIIDCIATTNSQRRSYQPNLPCPSKRTAFNFHINNSRARRRVDLPNFNTIFFAKPQDRGFVKLAVIYYWLPTPCVTKASLT